MIDWDALQSYGWSFFPVHARSADPAVKWKRLETERPSPDEVADWKRRGYRNVGIVTGAISGFFALDVDSDEAQAKIDTLGMPPTMTVKTKRGKHYYLKHPGFKVKNAVAILDGKIDIRGDGGFVIGPGSHHKKDHGFEYTWEDPSPIADAPQWLLDEIKPTPPPPTPKTNGAKHHYTGDAHPFARAVLERALKRIREAKEGIRNKTLNNRSMNVGHYIVSGGLSETSVRAELLAAALSNGTPEREALKTIESGLSAGMAESREIPERDQTKRTAHKVPELEDEDQEPSSSGDAATGEEITAAENSELFLSDALVEKYNGRLRYVPKWGHFLLWDGTVWRQDDKREVYTAARELAARASHRLVYADKLAQAKAIAMSKTVRGVVSLTEVHAEVSASEAQWDVNDWIINTPGGVVDLKTGNLREGEPEEYCTKITAVAPAPTVPTDCLWLRVLDRVCAPGVPDFIKRIAGYSLTGSTREEAFFFAYGTGANGKSKVFGAISGALGDYHTAAAPDTFTATKYKDHPTELAMLRGARLVTAHETEEGRSWSEARIKQITGGDKITARFMGRDFFEFRPGFKLLIVGNHKPRLRNVDYAMRRRIKLIPFNVQIPEAERDADLENKLKAEWPIILRWAIEGCLEWQRDGLNEPDAVIEATNDYLTDEDSVGQWLAERCEILPDHRETSRRLWESWKLWAEANDPHNVGSQKRLAGKLESHKLVPYRIGKNRGFVGVRVIE